MRRWLSGMTVKSGEGWRTTFYDDNGPVVSFYGLDRGAVYDKARRYFEATPEPIDAILQATLLYGKRATA